MTLGQRISQLRKQRGINQVQLAEALKVSPSTIAMWETNKRAIKDDTILELSDYFGVTTDYLLGKNQTPEWANDNQVIELDKILKSKAGMAYGPEGEISDEDREAIDDLIAGYFWQKKRKEERNK